MTKDGLTRRALLVGGAAVAASAVVGVLARPFAAEASAEAVALRPPGALAEGGFLERCIRCERCISVCPEGVLEPMGIEQGALRVRTPALSFADGSCTFCDLCRTVCPTAAIGRVDPYAPAEGRIGVALVHEDRCLAFVQDGSCGVCVDACQYEALSFDASRRPAVDDALCNGCGECVRICPANVLTSFGGGTARGIEVVPDRECREMGDV